VLLEILHLLKQPSYLSNISLINGGSLPGTLRQFITHVGPSHKTEHDDKVTVKLASPVQQIIDQAKAEVERVVIIYRYIEWCFDVGGPISPGGGW
jgi:hypothetical protein